MRVAVLSDSHGVWEKAVDSLALLNCDAMIFLGDKVCDGEDISAMLNLKMWCVCGNCDFYCNYDKELVIDIEGVKILVCHGDLYGVKNSLLRLNYRAKELGCSVALFGHTHIYCDINEDGVRLINPGAVGSSRDGRSSFAFLDINAGKVSCSRVLL